MPLLRKLFGDRKFIGSLLFLALPIAVQNLLNALLNIIDSFMTSNLGDASMGAVLLANQYIFIYQLMILVIGNSASIFISQYYGKGDCKTIPKYTGFALLIALGLSVLFTTYTVIFPQTIMAMFGAEEAIAPLGTEFLRVDALSFLPYTISVVFYTCLRGIKRVKLAVVGSLVGIVCNCFFNYVLMFGKFGFPELGLNGAAWGTVISRSIECVVVVACVLARKTCVTASPVEMIGYSKPFVKEYFKIFLPTVMNEIFWVLGGTAYFAIFARMPDSQTVLAALNVTQSIDKMIFVFLIGIGNATSVVIGNLLGAGKLDEAKTAGKHCLAFAIAAGIALGILNYCVGFLLPVFFTQMSEASIVYAKQVLLTFSIFLFVRSFVYTAIIGVLRTGGDTKFCMILETLTIWLVAVPLCALGGLVLHLHIALIYAMIFCEEVLKIYFLVRRFRSGKWVRNLTKIELPVPPLSDETPLME